jgi:hypothetical protein
MEGTVKKLWDLGCTDAILVENGAGEYRLIVQLKDACLIVPKEKIMEQSAGMGQYVPKVQETVWVGGQLFKDLKEGDRLNV